MHPDADAARRELAATDQSRYNTATQFLIRTTFDDGVEIEIRHDGDNGILFEGTDGRIFVNRGKLTGAPLEELKSNPLPNGAMEEAYTRIAR